jgi:cytochrome c oxidase subunit I+III
VNHRAFDASTLPSYKFSHASLMWWGLMGLIAIESTAFALSIATYFYLWSQAGEWPPRSPPPSLTWGSLNVAILVVSILPYHWTKRVAERGDERAMRIGLVLCALFGLALLAVRALEFTALNCRWDTDAYGSAVWLLLGLHTTHLITDVYDTIVLGALFFFSRPLEGKRHVDVSENSMYWYFVVWSWLPIYAVIYLMPRLT